MYTLHIEKKTEVFIVSKIYSSMWACVCVASMIILHCGCFLHCWKCDTLFHCGCFLHCWKCDTLFLSCLFLIFMMNFIFLIRRFSRDPEYN